MEERIFRFLQGDMDEEERRQLDVWRRASPQNEAVFRQIERLYLCRQLLVPTLDQSAPPLAQEILRRARVRGRWARRSAPWAAVAAAAAAVVLLAVPSRRLTPDPADAPLLRAAEFVTETDEQSTVQLGDGSVVRLGPDSRLTVLPLPSERRVSLTGRAIFDVARDEKHTFTVVTGEGEVVVKGTRFGLEAQDGRLQLMVFEGQVELRAGHEVVQVRGGEVAHALDGSRPIVRMGKFVAFESTPFRIVADELERRFGMRVVIMDSSIAERPVTSWSTDRTAREIVAAICSALNVSCAVTDTLTVVK